jgi:hypothetical protein
VPVVPSHSKTPSRGSKPGRLKQLTKKQRGIAAGSIAAIVILIVVLLVVTGGSPSTPSSNNSPKTTVPVLAANICPLTGLPAAGGAVPPRPALLVKIGNEPEGARPQSGLNEADIVFDTPAEGFVMRYMAVYQCSDASAIGPNRSVRWVDYHLAREFVDPILAFAGGINPNVDAVMGAKWLYGANLLGNAASAGHRTTNRVAPDNLYTSTAALYGFYKSRTDIPKPVFTYSATVPAGATPASSAQIDFSGGTDATWQWNPSGNDWLHGYAGSGPDIDQGRLRPGVGDQRHHPVGPLQDRAVHREHRRQRRHREPDARHRNRDRAPQRQADQGHLAPQGPARADDVHRRRRQPRLARSRSDLGRARPRHRLQPFGSRDDHQLTDWPTPGRRSMKSRLGKPGRLFACLALRCRTVRAPEAAAAKPPPTDNRERSARACPGASEESATGAIRCDDRSVTDPLRAH